MEARGRASLASMEETQLWKQIFKSQFQATPSLLSSSNSSWEEKAFAEDTSGPLGGSIWPPRSYSCNFCMREFRSAQALGGHMNVHRRDRARLQQSFATSHIENLHDENDPARSLMAAKSNISSKMISNPCVFTSTTRVSINQSEWSDSVGFRLVSLGESKPPVGEKKPGGGGGGGLSPVSGNEEGLYVETDLSMNSFVSLQNRPSGFCGNEVMMLSSKRPKISISSVSFCDIYTSNTGSGSTEEQLDLELRLGDPPKVN